MVPRPRVSRFKFVDADIEHVRENLPKTRECVDLMPMSRSGKISMENLQFSMGSFEVWRMDCATGVEARFRAPPDSYCMYLPLGGMMEVRCGGLDLVSRPGTILVGALSQTEIVRKHDDRSHIAICVSRGELTRQLSELLDAPVQREIDLALEVEAGSAAYDALTSLGHLLWANLVAGADDPLPRHSADCLFKATVVSMLELLPHAYSDALSRPVAGAVPWQVKRAIDYMMENIDRPIVTADIARAIDVSVRSLQAAFQQFKDTTPSAYLKRLRLEGARRDLLAATGGTVTDVARQWGFVHMGRFSEQYRSAYGELPSETIRGQRRDRA